MDVFIAASYMTCEDCAGEIDPGDEYVIVCGDVVGIDCGCAAVANA